MQRQGGCAAIVEQAAGECREGGVAVQRRVLLMMMLLRIVVMEVVVMYG